MSSQINGNKVTIRESKVTTQQPLVLGGKMAELSWVLKPGAMMEGLR
jgi:hypothetical protein